MEVASHEASPVGRKRFGREHHSCESHGLFLAAFRMRIPSQRSRVSVVRESCVLFPSAAGDAPGTPVFPEPPPISPAFICSPLCISPAVPAGEVLEGTVVSGSCAFDIPPR